MNEVIDVESQGAGVDEELDPSVLTIAEDSGLTVNEVRAKLAVGLSYCSGRWRHYGDESVAYYEDNH